ncbi:MAG: hypothetical protein K8R88_02660 [Armatimonadetes bacterium]|nr:hypothetical protein [Armatimonadota bacterium]
MDRGGTWSDITGNFPMGTSTNTTYNWSQYTYDFHIHTSSDGVNDVVYVGLIDVAQSPTGSNVWRSIGNAYFSNSKLHNDQHSFGVNPNNPSECLMGGDGGVFRLNYNSGAASWTITPLNEKLGGTTQFYHAAYHPTNAAILIGGTQDNASPASRGDLNHWDNPGAGDGGFAVISQSNPALQYNTSQGLNLYKTTNTWASSSNVSVPNPLSESTPFIAPIYGDPTNGNVLYAGRQSLYRYTNGPNTWEGPLGGVTMSAGGTIRSIAVAASNGNRIYAGSADGKVFRSLDRGATWTNITGTIPNRIIKDIAVDPANADSLLIVLGGASGVARVYQCLNGGSATPTWTSKSGSGGSALPDITHSTVCIDPRAPTTTWYVGADVGAFMTKDAGATWSNITNPLGLPNVRVDELTFVPGQASLYVATHGRGIWRIDTGSTALQALTFSKNPIYSANTLTITVQLTVAAPAGGAVVSLSSNNVGVVAPPIDVIVPQGSNTASVNVAVPYRTADATALITASMNDQQISNTVLVKFLQADINHDGIVDLTDYTRLLNAFDATSASANWDAPCDLNGDGIVDLTDYTIVVVQFNLGGS